MTAAQHGINWTQVLLLGIPAYIAALGGAVAAVIAALNHRNMKTPSGDRIGAVVERAHDLAAVSAAARTGVMGAKAQRATDRLSSETEPPGGKP